MIGKIAVGAIVLAVVSLASAEIGLRHFLGLGHPVLFNEFEEYGVFPQANQDVTRFGKRIVTNQMGMRSAPFDEKKPSGEIRIEFIGDSIPFGTTFVDQSEIFPSKIELALNEQRPNSYKILNASSPGWAAENEYRYLKANGISSSDLVVAVYNTKDLTQPFSKVHDSPVAPTTNPSSALAELWIRYLKPRLGLSPHNRR